MTGKQPNSNNTPLNYCLTYIRVFTSAAGSLNTHAGATEICKELHFRSIIQARRVAANQDFKARVVVTLDAQEGHAPLEAGGTHVPTRWSYEYLLDEGAVRGVVQETRYKGNEGCTPEGVNPAYCVCAVT